MAQLVKLKRTAVQGKVPSTSNVELGELAINTYDGRIFFEKSSSAESIQEILTTNAGRPITGSLNLTAAITASHFKGDGSALTNVSANISEQATVTSSFDNATTVNVAHNFSSKNVIVSVYDSSDGLIIPQSVTLTSVDNVRVVLSQATSGFVVVAKGGHVLSGSADNANQLNGQTAAYYLNYNNFTNVPGGLVSGSEQITDGSGLVSSSAQLTSTFDTRYLNTNGDSVISSSAQLTSTFDTRYLNTNGDGVISGSVLRPNGDSVISSSAQLTSTFDTRYLNTNGDGVVSGSVLRTLNGTGVFSGSEQVNANTITNFDTNVKAKLTEENVISGSEQVFGDISGGDITINSSGVAAIANGVIVNTDVKSDAAIASSKINFNSSGLISGSVLRPNGDGVISGSSQVNANTITNFDTNVKAKLTEENVISGSSQITDGSGIVSSSAFSSPSQGTVRATINGSNTDVDTGLQTGDSPQFTNLTLTGNLTVNGSTTTVESTTVNIGDNILELNYGGSATTGGILVKDGTGSSTVSGSLLWDSTNDYWKAGKLGSEQKLLRADSDGVISGSDITLTTAAQPNVTSLGTLTSLTVDDISIDGSTISDSGDLTLDIGGDLNIDVDGTDIILKDGGTSFGRFKRDSSDFIIKSETNNKDIVFRGQDGGSTIDALTLDMSEAGTANFNSHISSSGDLIINQFIKQKNQKGFIKMNGDYQIRMGFDANQTGNVAIIDSGIEIGRPNSIQSGFALEVLGTARLQGDTPNLIFQPTGSAISPGKLQWFAWEPGEPDTQLFNDGAGNFRIQHNERPFSGDKFKIDSSGNIHFNDAYKFPTSDGNANEVLATDGSGTLSFTKTTHKETVSGATSYAVTHNLNEQYPIVQCWHTGTSKQELPDSVTTNSANQVTVTFNGNFAGVIIVKK